MFKIIVNLTLIIFILTYYTSLGFAQNPNEVLRDVQRNLVKAGKNRAEVEKVIAHFKKGNNPLKLKAAYFLIANMDIHYSANYYWADRQGRKVDYNELSYPDVKTAERVLAEKQRSGGLTAVPIVQRDLETIKADFLIDDIERAFSSWRKSDHNQISFKKFCEYILPYRVTVEPLQNWRDTYSKHYKWISDSLKYNVPFLKVLSYLGVDYNKSFSFALGDDVRTEPLPRLGAMQLLFRRNGECGDIAALETFILRSQGIAASYNVIPYWGTTTGRHFVNTAFDKSMRPVRIDVTTQQQVNGTLAREPAKVIRITYGKQRETVASLEKTDNIPDGFMRSQNYVDITNEYWRTADVTCKLTKTQSRQKNVYACVFEAGGWKPTWWGREKGGQVTFTKMAEGTVILPVFYKSGSLIPAAYPQIVGQQMQQELNPNYKMRRDLVIKGQDKYLIFRPGSKYVLFYWDKAWKNAGEKTAVKGSNEIVFQKVPTNALYLLRPEYSQGRERPFIINQKGDRYWY